MDLKEFIRSGMVRSQIEYKNFKAEISYSAPGSGHYFTLSNLVGSRKDLLSFLSTWEGNYTFCFVTENQLVKESLAKRQYNSDGNGCMRIGIKEESNSERFERLQREKVALPRTARRTDRVSAAAKATVQKKIKVRKEKQQEAAE